MSLVELEDLLNSIDDLFYTYVLAALLVLVGIFLTVRIGAVQFRHLFTMMRTIADSRTGAKGGISSFQAFTIGLASRVGTGNIVGVALS